MQDRFSKISVLLAVMFLLSGPFFISPVRADIASTDSQKQLQDELKGIEDEIEQFSSTLAKTKAEKLTLANKIKQLKIRQSALQLQIKETALKITDLSGKIGVLEGNIKTNLSKEEALKLAIAGTLRQLNEIDNNFIVALATADGFSGFLDRMKEFQKVSEQLQSLRVETKSVRVKLTSQQNQLEDQKSDASNYLQIKSIQEKGVLGTITDSNQLLEQTKGLETNFQSMLNDSKQRASEIRNRIYELFNTGAQINFGQAVDIAKWASGLTGVRPAFLLAVLTQESNLGKNVGTCNRAGDPASKSWKVIMKPERDQEPFAKITDALGFDVNTTPVSCPMHDRNGKQIGWGGAMGPAQFIPSTWMGYKAKVESLTGKSPANPWDIRDAFLAAAVKLKDGGANGTDDGDWAAAMRYFAGSVNKQFRFYGDNVLATTKQYLQDIAELR